MTTLPQRLHTAAQEILVLHPHLPSATKSVIYQVIERLMLEAQCAWEQTVIDRFFGMARCGCSPMCPTCQFSLTLILKIVEAAAQPSEDAYTLYTQDWPDEPLPTHR